MRAGSGFVATAITMVLGTSGGVFAQDAPTQAPEVAGEGGATGAVEVYPPPPPTGVYRPFSLSIAVGPGAMFGPGEQILALSHNVVRVGWGLARDLSFFASIEGARAPSVNPATRARSWLRHETFSAGVQYHFLQSFYVRGSAGVGLVGEETARQSFSGGRGIATSAAVGVEIAQVTHTALGFELAGNVTRYPREYWGTAGLNLVLSLF
jgi:hypothetical protein